MSKFFLVYSLYPGENFILRRKNVILIKQNLFDLNKIFLNQGKFISTKENLFQPRKLI